MIWGLISTYLLQRNYFFSESQSRFLVSVKADDATKFERLFATEKLVRLGEVTEVSKLIVHAEKSVITAELSELKQVWEGAIPCLLK